MKRTYEPYTLYCDNILVKRVTPAVSFAHLGISPLYLQYLVWPIGTRPVQDPLAVIRLKNQVYIYCSEACWLFRCVHYLGQKIYLYIKGFSCME